MKLPAGSFPDRIADRISRSEHVVFHDQLPSCLRPLLARNCSCMWSPLNGQRDFCLFAPKLKRRMLDCMSWTKLRRVEHRTTPTTLRRLIKVIQCQVCPSLQQHTKRPVVISTFRAFALRPVSYGRRAIARNVKLPPVLSRVVLISNLYFSLARICISLHYKQRIIIKSRYTFTLNHFLSSNTIRLLFFSKAISVHIFPELCIKFEPLLPDFGIVL